MASAAATAAAAHVFIDSFMSKLPLSADGFSINH